MAVSPVEQYIRMRAQALGIDPDVAVKVASGEGGLQDPFRRGQGPAPHSQAPGLGATENSYGPLQLYVSGTGAGLGDRALAAGIDPRKDWQGGVDFALNEAKNKGWGQWYGAKAQGITGMQGIGGAPASLSPQAAAFVQNNPQPGGFGSGVPDPNAAPSSILGPSPQPSPLGPPGIPNDIAQYAADDQKTPGQWLHGAFQKLQNFPDAPQVRFGPMGDARNSGSDLLKQMNAPTLSDLLSKKRLVG